MANDASAGRASGSMIAMKVRQRPAPSIRAASSTSPGILLKNWVMRKTPSGAARRGRISAGYEFWRWAPEIMRNSGTNIASRGTIRPASTTTNSARRPGNRILANAYPAIAQKTTVMTVVRQVTTTLLRNQRARLESENTVVRFVSVSDFGRRLRDDCCNTSLGVNAIDSIHRIGTNQVNAATIISV